MRGEITPGAASTVTLKSSAGAAPKDTTSESESICAPKSDADPVMRAIFPSTASKIMAKSTHHIAFV